MKYWRTGWESQATEALLRCRSNPVGAGWKISFRQPWQERGTSWLQNERSANSWLRELWAIGILIGLEGPANDVQNGGPSKKNARWLVLAMAFIAIT